MADILITESDKKSLLTIRKMVEESDATDEHSIDYECMNLLETIDRAIYNLENGLQYYKYIPNKQFEDWYHAECESCGWNGMSNYLWGGGAIADTGDHFDCICPVCGSPKIS